VAESASDLARVWTEQGHQVHLLASDASAPGRIDVPQAAALAHCRVSLYRADFAKKQGLGLGAVGMIWRAIKDADLIYIAGVSTWPTTLALLFCRLRRKPFGLGVRGGFLREHVAHIRAKKPIKWLFYNLLVRPMASGARCIHAMSEMEQEHVAPFFKAPTVVASLGVDCRVLRSEPPLAPLPNGGRRYLYVGRFSPEKSVVAMLRAWLDGARSQDRLTLAGDGPGEYAERVKSLASADERVAVLGYVPRGQVFEQIRAHDFLIMPSGMEADVRENFGIVVAEALALGRPVLSAKGLAWDTLDSAGAGIVFLPEATAFQAALRESSSLTSQAYSGMAAAARAFAEERLDLSDQALQLFHRLESISDAQ
jgi:glycosyltransferase involved in cell wall biosynthesis